MIPVHNGERYLAEALESVLVQSHRAIEVVVIDDGSTDRSLEIARQFGPRVRCHAQERAGPAAARNHGVSVARGSYLTFLDADDLWEPDKLDRQLEAIGRDRGPDLVFGHAVQFESPELEPAESAGTRPTTNPQPARQLGAMLTRRETWNAVGSLATEWRVGEFLDWLGRAQHLGLREAMLPNVVLRRRLHPSGHSARNREAMGDYARILKAALDRRRADARR